MCYFSKLLKLVILPFTFAVNFAVTLGSCFFSLTYFPCMTMYSNYEHMTVKQKLIWCFNFNAGMMFGLKFLIDAETRSE